MASKAGNKPEQADSDQALALREEGAMVAPSDFDDIFGGGSSDFGQGDLSVPFIRIVQALSPILQPADPSFNRDARQGQIIETVSQTLIDGDRGILIVPVFYARSYTEWAPNRGGLIKDHGSDPTIMTKSTRVETPDGKVKMVTPDGNDLAEAALYYVLFNKSETGFWDQAILTLAGTQWKAARNWNSSMARLRLFNSKGTQIQNPLPFAGCYRFTTVTQKKDNYNFFGWKIELHKPTFELPRGAELVKSAMAFRELASKGQVKGNDVARSGDEIPGFDDSDVL